MESGQNPERCRHCRTEHLQISGHWKTGKSADVRKSSQDTWISLPEPGSGESSEKGQQVFFVCPFSDIGERVLFLHTAAQKN